MTQSTGARGAAGPSGAAGAAGPAGPTGPTGPTGPAAGTPDATFIATSGAAQAANPTAIFKFNANATIVVPNGFAFMAVTTVTCDGSNYWHFEVYDCAPGQAGSDGTLLASYSSASSTVTKGTVTNFTAANGISFPYTLAAGHSFQATVTKVGSLTTPWMRVSGQ